MSDFEEALARVLDPQGLYWRYPGDDSDHQDRVRMIEQRLDVPSAQVSAAQKGMEQIGWTLAYAPDDNHASIQRLYFRKPTSLTSEAKTEFLTAALRVAYETNSTLSSWINVEDRGEK